MPATKEKKVRPVTEADRQRLMPAMDLLKREAHRNVRFVDAAKLVFLSPYHFHREFTRVFGITPKKLSAAAQVEKAKAMLLQDKPREEIADACGFCHVAHFGTRFKGATGTTPGKWAQANKAA